MKKTISLLLALVLMFALCTTAFAAAPSTTGFYDVGEMTGAELTADGEKLNVTLTGATKDKQYLVLLVNGTALPTKESDILYIDQTQATGTSVSFTVYPTITATNESMTVYLTSDDTAFTTKSAAVKYNVASAVKKGDLNENGRVDAKDASIVLQVVVGKRTLTEITAADVNENSRVDAKDASIILQAVVGKRTLS